jgi:hypothetical protein
MLLNLLSLFIFIIMLFLYSMEVNATTILSSPNIIHNSSNNIKYTQYDTLQYKNLGIEFFYYKSYFINIVIS